jgi:hypothetical protein
MTEGLRADANVLLDGEIGKHRKFRHVGHAAPHALAGAHPRDIGVSKRDAAMPDSHQPDQRFQKRRLACAIGAEQQHRFPGPHVKVDLPEHLHGAVAGVDAAGPQQRVGVRRHVRLPKTPR